LALATQIGLTEAVDITLSDGETIEGRTFFKVFISP